VKFKINSIYLQQGNAFSSLWGLQYGGKESVSSVGKLTLSFVAGFVTSVPEGTLISPLASNISTLR
jgi:hypothetical protein